MMYYQTDWITIYNGDCREVLSETPDDSMDLLVTDPPYGISFMGKDWDKALPDKKIWAECLRVLKPGAFAFVMSIPRSDCQARMVIALQDAGFRVDFTPLYWAYASGFPKASNIGKMVDKRGGKYLGWFIDYIIEIAEGRGISKQELTMLFPSRNGKPTGWLWNKQFTQAITLEQYNKIKDFLSLPFESIEEAEREVLSIKGSGKKRQNASFSNGLPIKEIIDIPATPQAKALDGSYGGFQPKPAVEVIIVAMKPLSEKTFVDQALKNGKGITWLDDCRVPYESEPPNIKSNRSGQGRDIYGGGNGIPVDNTLQDYNPSGRFPANLLISDDVLNDNGDSFSRYFDLDKWASTLPFLIVPKASKSEKGKDCTHPTVKPLKLMSYLITLGSREGDTILDPFLGSGTTALASQLLGRKCIGIEVDEKYCEIAINRCRQEVMELVG